MSLSQSELRDIVVRASTPVERQHSNFLLEPLPHWATTLQEALEWVEVMVGKTVTVDKGQWLFLDANAPFPFEEILFPFVVTGYQHYTARSFSAYQLLSYYHLLSYEAQQTLQRHLLHMLSSLSVQALYAEFTSQYPQVSAQADWDITALSPNDRIFYQQFVNQMYQGGLSTFFSKYSVLARQLATTTDLWVEANLEFLQRLDNDIEVLQQTFSPNGKLGEVTQIQPALSEPHHGRRTAMALTFASGCKLVYKPRNVGIEESYYRLLTWYNAQGVAPPFKTLTILNRSNYGWLEFVEHEACQDQEAVQRYFYRAGMLLCLVYVLGGAQCFYKHIIAHGEHPVLVDASALLHPSPHLNHPQIDAQQPEGAWEKPRYSVLSTGLLTSWQTPSPLSHPKEQTLSVQKAQNTPSMHLAHDMLRIRKPLHIPIYNALPVHREGHSQNIVAGFEQMYQTLLQHRSALLESDSPLYALKNQYVRFFYRPTWAYNKPLQKLLAPEYLGDGTHRHSLLEALGQPPILVEAFLRGQAHQAHWQPALVAEQDALLQGDIPFFIARADQHGLVISDKRKLPDCFHSSSFDLMLHRLTSLSNEDMQRQVALLQGTL